MKNIPVVIVCMLYCTCKAYPSPQPIIGIFVQGCPDKSTCADEYMFTAYKSFVEQGGGGVVPVFLNQSDEYYEKLIPKLNGVLLPGGDIKNLLGSSFDMASLKVRDMAMQMNDAGIHYPVWGSCQGFEEMVSWPTSKDLLVTCTGTDGVSLPVTFESAAKTSRLYGHMSANLWHALATENITANNHDECVSKDTFVSNIHLNTYYSLLTTNMDGSHLEYVSSFEHKKYPFYAVQFHPEKANFYHKVGNTYDHSKDAVRVSQYYANFLINEAKKNRNSFGSLEEEARFIINQYNTKFSSKTFNEIYCLSSKSIPPFDK